MFEHRVMETEFQYLQLPEKWNKQHLVHSWFGLSFFTEMVRCISELLWVWRSQKSVPSWFWLLLSISTNFYSRNTQLFTSHTDPGQLRL